MNEYIMLLWLLISATPQGDLAEVRVFSGSYSIEDCNRDRDRMEGLIGNLPKDQIIPGRIIVEQAFVCEAISEPEYLQRQLYAQNQDYLLYKHLSR